VLKFLTFGIDANIGKRFRTFGSKRICASVFTLLYASNNGPRLALTVHIDPLSSILVTYGVVTSAVILLIFGGASDLLLKLDSNIYILHDRPLASPNVKASCLNPCAFSTASNPRN
jgi:hypothetical protein